MSELRAGIDAAGFAAVEQTAFQQGWRADQFSTTAPYLGHGWYDDKRCVAFVYAMMLPGEAELLRIACRPEVRRRGLAGQLLAALIASCRAAESEQLFLEVARDNHAARAFYGSHGFGQIGCRKDYYGPGQDALLLTLAL